MPSVREQARGLSDRYSNYTSIPRVIGVRAGGPGSVSSSAGAAARSMRSEGRVGRGSLRGSQLNGLLSKLRHRREEPMLGS